MSAFICMRRPREPTAGQPIELILSSATARVIALCQYPAGEDSSHIVHTAILSYLPATVIPNSGFLSREKTSANFQFLWRFVKVFSAKIYFQAIRYRASGHGALGYRKFAKVFSAKIYFQAIHESFLPRKKPAIW